MLSGHLSSSFFSRCELTQATTQNITFSGLGLAPSIPTVALAAAGRVKSRQTVRGRQLGGRGGLEGARGQERLGWGQRGGQGVPKEMSTEGFCRGAWGLFFFESRENSWAPPKWPNGMAQP